MDYAYLLLVPLAFVCEFIDSTLGMGYGTSLTPLLLLLGYEPLQIVPAVLLSEFVTGILGASTHHNLRNVNFHPSSMDTKVAMVLSGFSVIGTVAAVLLMVRLPSHVLKIIIGVIVLSMGVIIIITRNHVPRFNWLKIITLGSVASFNKGLSGGGYGPLVMGGQMLSGVGVKNAVGITSLSEGITCLAGVVMFFIVKKDVNWSLAPWLMAGAVLSVPMAAHTLRWIPEKAAKTLVAMVVLLLGSLTLFKAIL